MYRTPVMAFAISRILDVAIVTNNVNVYQVYRMP